MSNIREQKGTSPCMIGTIKIKQKKKNVIFAFLLYFVLVEEIIID